MDKSEPDISEVLNRALRQTLAECGLPNNISDSDLESLVQMAKEYNVLLTEDIFAHINRKYMPWQTEDELRHTVSKETKLIHIEHQQKSRAFHHSMMCYAIFRKTRREVTDEQAEAVAQFALKIKDLI